MTTRQHSVNWNVPAAVMPDTVGTELGSPCGGAGGLQGAAGTGTSAPGRQIGPHRSLDLCPFVLGRQKPGTRRGLEEVSVGG